MEKQEQQPEITQVDRVKAELHILRDLRMILKHDTKVSVDRAEELAKIWNWLGLVMSRSEQYIADENKKKKADAKKSS